MSTTVHQTIGTPRNFNGYEFLANLTLDSLRRDIEKIVIGDLIPPGTIGDQSLVVNYMIAHVKQLFKFYRIHMVGAVMRDNLESAEYFVRIYDRSISHFRYTLYIRMNDELLTINSPGHDKK